MSWWDQLVDKVKQSSAAGKSRRQLTDWDGREMTPELELRQPFSDGSEEFFYQFMPRDNRRWPPNKQVIIGLGITAGVLAGVGVAVWLRKSKSRKGWRQIFGEV